jgi:hypothetical protein
VLYFLRSFAFQGSLMKLRRTLRRFQEDEEFRRFHEGATPKLPTYYRCLYVKRLGRYAELVSEADMTPELEARAATPTRSIPKPLSAAADRPAASTVGV